ncbi:MAG TPA: beta-propeller fold lactonase family protein [Burkholderiales bacterium]|nr:beta-propeller fold lactonase family protein [Burkholderiales bacterium]
MAKAVLYSCVGEEMTRYEVDVAGATLTRRETIQVPAVVQYAWPHPSRRTIYVATSNRGSAAGMTANLNHLSAYRINATDGKLTLHGERKTLPHRAVHICVEPNGGHVLSAHNLPETGITVNAINGDETLGDAVTQPNKLDYGIYPHQVMAAPSGRATILVDRGNDAAKGKPEDPGALRLYRFDNGVHADPQVVAPNGGYGFGPRHLDFHPTQPWVYVSLERQSQLYVWRMKNDRLETEPAYVREMLADRANLKPRQHGGTVHVHPNGRVVYLMNRADCKVDYQGQKVFGGGENSIAVYAIDQKTGEPTLIQHQPTHSYHVRTFAIDPTGKLMVAASIQPMAVREGDKVVNVPAALSVFRVSDDGRLDFVRKYDVETNGKIHYWMGIVGLA